MSLVCAASQYYVEVHDPHFDDRKGQESLFCSCIDECRLTVRKETYKASGTSPPQIKSSHLDKKPIKGTM